LYEYVVANWSDKPRAMYAHTALVRDCIRLRDKQAARTYLEQLAQRYATNTQLPNVLTEIARGYREAQMYQEAKLLSENVLRSYAGNEQCIWAQRDIILCDIAHDDQDAAQGGLQKLVNNYADHGYFPYVLNEIAEGYRQGQMYQQAKWVSQYVLAHFPGSDQCLWAQRDIVLSDLASKNIEAANSGIQTLQSRFAKQPSAIWAISDVAEAFAKLGRHEQARDLFRFNLNNCPDLDDTIWSLRDFVRESIALRDQAGIDAGVKKLFSDYSASKNLPMAAVHIGMDLCKAGHPQAGELFQYVIDKHPDHEQATFAKVCMGHLLIRRGEDSQAESIYQEILAKYANHPRLAEVVALIAEGYFLQGSDEFRQGNRERARSYLREAIAKTDVVTTRVAAIPAQAAQATATAFHIAGLSCRKLQEFENASEYLRVIVDRYPDYSNISDASYTLGLCCNLAKQYREAIKCLDQSLQRWPDHRFAPEARNARLNAYNGLYQTGAISLEDAIAATSAEFMLGPAQSRSAPGPGVPPEGADRPSTSSGEIQEGARK